MPERFPDESERDVVAVAHRGALSIPEVVTDFGFKDPEA